MTEHDFSINFSGLTHDHTILDNLEQKSVRVDKSTSGDEESCSTIAILRRHPMYDCLVLVKKYRTCLGGYSLEFPVDLIEQEKEEDFVGVRNCSRRKLVSKFLDGDDPMYQCCNNGAFDLDHSTSGHNQAFSTQLDEQGNSCDLVHVPINGLLDRLKNYTKSGIAVDSRVYAFAMGLKTAERILTTGSVREPQETPV